jgi:hypothetical protein
MSLPRIIGLTGYAGVGKDTVADLLVREHGYVKLSLADPIKELLNTRFGWTMEDWSDRQWKEAAIVLYMSPAGDSMYLSPRILAQWLGTEVGRYLAGPDVWLEVMWRKYQQHCYDRVTGNYLAPLVVPDVRFDNEADFIRSKGGVVVRITRMGAKPVAAHVSEAGLSRPADLTIENFGDIEEFKTHAFLSLQTLRRAG